MNDKFHRPIRSFVKREGRMTHGQQLAIDTLWSKHGIDYQPTLLDFSLTFHHHRPVILEIGFGNGESLITMAENHPGLNYIGIEVHRPGVGHLLNRIDELNLSNIKIINHDAVDVLQHCIPDESLTGVNIFFPDPWPKKRHNKRRIIQPKFVELLTRKIKSSGRLHLATDWQPYALHMMTVMNELPQFINHAGFNCFAPRPAWRPLTKFEQRGLNKSHQVFDLLFDKK